MFDLFKRLSLLQKITIAIVAALVLSSAVLSVIFVKQYETGKYEEMEYKARAIAQMAQNARNTAAEMQGKYNALKASEMLAEAVADLKGMKNSSPEWFQKLYQTRYYNTAIPVVWSFKAAKEGAEKSHFFL